MFMANKKSVKKAQTKKEFKKEVAGTIESALPVLKVKLGEKKFSKRIKKAAKLLTEGLHPDGEHKKSNKAKPGDAIKILKEKKAEKIDTVHHHAQ